MQPAVVATSVPVGPNSRIAGVVAAIRDNTALDVTLCERLCQRHIDSGIPITRGAPVVEETVGVVKRRDSGLLRCL